MSALARVLAVSVLSVCLFNSVPGTVAVDPPISGCGTKPADIVFLLDTSTTVGDANFDKVKEFVKQYVTSFKIGPMDVNVGVVTFDTETRNAFWLNTYTSERSLLEAIENIKYIGGSTYTHLGLEFVRGKGFTKAHGDRDGIANILIVVTDGKSTRASYTAKEANKLHDTDISVIAVGVGNADDKELNIIADNEKSVFHVSSFDSLESIQDKLKISTCGAINTTPLPNISEITSTTPEPITTNATEIPGTTPEPITTNTTEIPGTTPEPITTNATEIPGTTPEPITTNATGCGTQPADIVFLLDTSSSVADTNFDKVREFVKQFVKSLNIGPMDINVGVVTFDSEAREAFWLNTYTSESSLLEAIQSMKYIGGSTFTHLGLEFVRDRAFTKAHGDRDGIANILIVVTDGQSKKPAFTAEEANKLHETDISVMAIGVGEAKDEELNIIADNEQSVFHVTNFDSLQTIQDRLRTSMCGVNGTTPPFNISGCDAPQADIVFLLDTSGSVGTDNFKKVKEFVKDLSKAFKIGTEEVHIGVVTFASTAHGQFWLSNYTSESSLLEAIDRIHFSGGTTNTHDGLSYVRQHSFTEAQGDRDNVANILIVVTDGKSDNESETSDEALELHKTDLTVLVIGVGDQVDQSELEIIANGTDNVFNVTDFDALDTSRNALQKTACEAANATPPSNISECGTQPADIVFLLDTSSSVGDANIGKVREFVKDFTKTFKIGPKQTNIGVVTFDSTVRDEFWLSNYTSKSSLSEAIDSINYHGGTTNTHYGLCYIREHAFTKAQGDRDNIPNVLIVITAGISSNPNKTSEEARALHKTNMRVLVIGVSDSVDQSELETIANGKENVFISADFAALDTLLDKLQERACKVIAVAPPCETGDAHCLYKGQQYSQGKQWFDGCSQQCECQDAAAGRYQCSDWCPTYHSMPPQCYLAPVLGTCCQQPWCYFNMFYYVYTSQLVDQVNGQSACVYDGVRYFQSQTWAVDCDRFCVCNNAAIGLSVCQSECVQYDALPPNCWLQKPQDECCPRPVCTFFTLKGAMTGMANPSRYRGTVYSVFALQ